MAIASGRRGISASRNPRSTKNYGAGRRRTAIPLGPWLAAWILAWGPSSEAAPERTLWIFQQLAQLQPPAAHTARTVELGVDGVQYRDDFSLGAKARLPLGFAEIRMKAFERFPKSAASDRIVLGGELGRRFVTNRGHYGRLALEYLNFQPVNRAFAGILVHAGARDREDLPWSWEVNLSLRFSLQGLNNYLGLGMDTQRALGKGWRLGGGLGWWQRMRDAPIGVAEHRLIAVGPSLDWDSPVGLWRARAWIRVWLDKDGPGEKYLTEFDPPGASLAWSVRF